MSNILVSGLINIETTLKIDAFPVDYQPVRYPFHGIRSTVSGVGYNIAKALTVLGDSADFLSLVGDDAAGRLVYSALSADGIPSDNVLPALAQTAQSVIIYDGDGRRMVNTDLKDIQQQVYPHDRFSKSLERSDIAVLCNINFSRPFLADAVAAGISVATDVHVVSDIDDGYNRDFMACADILFMSNDSLAEKPETWVNRLQARFRAGVIVVGLGADGVLLAVRDDNFMERIPAVNPRPVVNTIGAGDALFSSFVHFYRQSGDPYEAIRLAVVFAGYKVGEAGAAEGFLTESQLRRLAGRVGS